MNWNFHISFVSTAIVIILLVLIYRKREVHEDMLGLKLVGYYLLGTFNLNFGFVLPVGIVIYLLFFRPHLNAGVKRYAAWLGLIMMIVGHWFPMI